MATDNNEKNAAEIRRAMTEDKDKIAAALNNALADTKGNPIKTPVSKKSAGRPKGQGKKAAPKAESKSKADGDGISPETKQFAEACYNLKIDVKMCHEESSKMEDPSIEEYVRSINKKIFDETRQGGYSTNVQFRVLPNDWVNVNHIIDWYATRGFKVDMKETTTPPYGKDVGTINYHFTISWAIA